MSEQDTKVTPQDNEGGQPEEVRVSADVRRPVGIIGDRVTAPPISGASSTGMLVLVFLFGCFLSAAATALIMREYAKADEGQVRELDARLGAACGKLSKIARDQINDALASVSDRNFGTAESDAKLAREYIEAASAAAGPGGKPGLEEAGSIIRDALDKLALNDAAAVDDLTRARRRISGEALGAEPAAQAEESAEAEAEEAPADGGAKTDDAGGEQ